MTAPWVVEHLDIIEYIAFGNHPSGNPEPSDSGRRITERLKEALGLMDIRVIDHVAVGSDGCKSFAEMGYL